VQFQCGVLVRFGCARERGRRHPSGHRRRLWLVRYRPKFLEWYRGAESSSKDYLFFSDTGNHCIRKIRLRDGEITTVVGTGTAGFSEDGATGVNAMIDRPCGLTLTDQGLFFAESGNQRVRLLRHDGTLTTIAGNGEWGFSGDCRDARFAELICPLGLCFNPYSGLLYVTDNGQVKVLGDYRRIESSSLI
jgi:hypothetical protein